MLLWTGGKWIEGLPPGLKSSDSPLSAFRRWQLVLIIAAIGVWTLSRTAFGRDFYAVGITCRRALGVAVNRTRMIALPSTAACGLRRMCLPPQIGFGAEPDRQRAGDEGHRRLRARWHLAAGGTGIAGRRLPRRVLPPNSIPCWCLPSGPGVVERLYRRLVLLGVLLDGG